jgi:DNA-binding transcriptional LysR family regulator
VEVFGRLAINDMEGCLRAAVAGVGVALLPSFMAEESVELGDLTSVLPRWTSREAPLYVVHPSNRYLPAKVRTFLDFVRDQAGDTFITS